MACGDVYIRTFVVGESDFGGVVGVYLRGGGERDCDDCIRVCLEVQNRQFLIGIYAGLDGIDVFVFDFPYYI